MLSKYTKIHTVLLLIPQLAFILWIESNNNYTTTTTTTTTTIIIIMITVRMIKTDELIDCFHP